MKRKGFTLIELLAVIVILAIIALIATPIVLNIIKDSKDSATLRSAENYMDAVETAIATDRLENELVKDGVYTVDGNGNLVLDDKTLTVEVKGNLPEAGSKVGIKNGQVVVDGTNLDYGDYTVTIDSKGKATATEKENQETGSTQVYKPQYYSGGEGDDWGWATSMGGTLPPDAKRTVEELNLSVPHYLGFDVNSDNEATTVYVCFVRNETEYCLKGLDPEAYTKNTEIIKDAFSDIMESPSCNSGYCEDQILKVDARSDGSVDVEYYVDGTSCYVEYFWDGILFGCK